MKKFILPLTLMIALGAVFLLTGNFQKSTTHFYGITDHQEQSVSFQEPVEVIEIKVIEGQLVEKGTVLLTARRSELSVKQEQLNGQIDELNARQSEVRARLNAEIRVLHAKKNADLVRIDAQIKQLQSQQQQNYALYQNITGSAPVANHSRPDPLQQQIRSFHQQQSAVSRSIQAQINSLRTQIKASEQPVFVQKKQIKKRLDEINRQAEELTIHADFTGRIGSINIKQGERAPSFQSIMTVQGLYPGTVKGYILENVSNDVHIGQQLWINTSYKNEGILIEGKVESLGNRIVEYPERLKRNQTLKSWGREVNIRLPIGNPLLLGEKVQISFTPPKNNTLEALLKPIRKETKTLFPKAFVDQTEVIK